MWCLHQHTASLPSWCLLPHICSLLHRVYMKWLWSDYMNHLYLYESDYMKWVQSFCACMFRFAGALLYTRKWHLELLQVIAPMDLGHLLLETDSALLLAPKYHSECIKHSNPLMRVDIIAKEVARLQHLPTTTTVNMACQNTFQFFHLIHQEFHPFFLPISNVGVWD